MSFLTRTLRSTQLAKALRPISTPSSSIRATTLRAFSTTKPALDSSGTSPVQIYGPGGKPGKIPTDEEQATGVERFELLGDLMGVDVWDLNPLEMNRMGTMDDPIPVRTTWPERHVGCTGYPADSHDTIWMLMNVKKEKHRCVECGCVYTLKFQGDPALLEEGHHHH